MKRVFLDDQLVSFEGTMPKDLSELLVVLSEHVEKDENYIEHLAVDGIDLLNPRDKASLPESYECIEAYSSPQGFYYLKQIDEMVKQTGYLVEAFETLSGIILNQVWEQSIDAINNTLYKVIPWIKVLEELELYANPRNLVWRMGIKDLLKEYKNCSNLYSSAIALSDAACLSDTIIYQWLPLINQTIELLEKTIVPYFQMICSKHETPVL